jgi:hypothetical protein
LGGHDFFLSLLPFGGLQCNQINDSEMFMNNQEAFSPKIDIPLQKIENFCLHNHIQTLALFEAEHIPGLIRLSELELELGEILGRDVDLRTPKDLSRYFRDEVITGAYPLYGKERFHST